MHASERQLARLRLAYLKAVLSQEIGAFDTDLTSGKIISGISNHMSIIQDAIGEKVKRYFKHCLILLIVTLISKSLNDIIDNYFTCSWAIFFQALPRSFREF